MGGHLFRGSTLLVRSHPLIGLIYHLVYLLLDYLVLLIRCVSILLNLTIRHVVQIYLINIRLVSLVRRTSHLLRAGASRVVGVV